MDGENTRSIGRVSDDAVAVALPEGAPAGLQVCRLGDGAASALRTLVQGTQGQVLELYPLSKTLHMFQFKPSFQEPGFEDFVLSETKSADKSTDLAKRPPPSPAIKRILSAVGAALPWLERHYVLGWIQVNVTGKREDSVQPHVDRAGWGDVIVVATSTSCTLKLKGVDGAAPREGFEVEVPAGGCYVLAGHARHNVKHAIDTPPGRIGVVFRFYLTDLCRLASRSPTTSTSAGVAPRARPAGGSVVLCRWPAARRSTKVHRNYRSVYPARVVAVNGNIVVVRFFKHDGDNGVHENDLEIHGSLVLPETLSTKWWTDADVPTAKDFVEAAAADGADEAAAAAEAATVEAAAAEAAAAEAAADEAAAAVVDEAAAVEATTVEAAVVDVAVGDVSPVAMQIRQIMATLGARGAKKRKVRALFGALPGDTKLTFTTTTNPREHLKSEHGRAAKRAYDAYSHMETVADIKEAGHIDHLLYDLEREWARLG
mmetsp:Transcript_3083/g.9399  ORF Transcript_3083/g.9399 Transcript_3083/m.9399 type:complete len:486 (+) Transcript_3083:155-1612(+)